MTETKMPTRIMGEWIWKNSLLNHPDSFLLMRKEFVCSTVNLDSLLWISANCAYQLFINGKVQTRMCVPNIMGFTGTANGGKLEVWKEAEYYWADTSVEDNPVRIAWDNAVKTVFEANDYSYYQPLPRVEETTEEAADAGSSSSSSSSGSTSAPAADAGGC